MIYSFIKSNEQLFPIEKMCKVLQVSNGSYYRWKKQTITARQQRKIAIKEQITLIYFESKQRYGSPRITLELQSLGYKISRITVAIFTVTYVVLTLASSHWYHNMYLLCHSHSTRSFEQFTAPRTATLCS